MGKVKTWLKQPVRSKTRGAVLFSVLLSLVASGARVANDHTRDRRIADVETRLGRLETRR